jgi:two-component system, chemotaxis family, chemotaxis protein CheY
MAFNVLVVDDSAVMRAMVIKTLRLSGLPLGDVFQAGNGAEGLELLQANWVDLALLDVNMPVMDGETMVDRIREDPATRDLAIVIVSTESSDTRIERLRSKGAAFVHKPFTPEGLREVVIQVTGVDHEQLSGQLAASGGELDF